MYNKLCIKYDSISLDNQTLTNENIGKEKKISKLNKDSKDLNDKFDTIRCRALSKSIIDFLYYTFTSCFKGKSYLEENNSIIDKIKSKKTNEYKDKEIILSELVRYLEKIYDLKIERDYFAHFEMELDRLIELIGFRFKNVNKLLKNLDLSLLFKKYKNYIKLKVEKVIVRKLLKKSWTCCLKKKIIFSCFSNNNN